jgi:hypothetical protein
MNLVQLICTAAVSHNGSTIALLKPVTSEDAPKGMQGKVIVCVKGVR